MDQVRIFLRDIVYADIEIETKGMRALNEDRKVSYIEECGVLYLYAGVFQMEIHERDIVDSTVENDTCKLLLKNNLKIFIKRG